MVLILAFEHQGSTMIPLEAAAKNDDFGTELVPVTWTTSWTGAAMNFYNR